jgi:hypothetical protein
VEAKQKMVPSVSLIHRQSAPSVGIRQRRVVKPVNFSRKDSRVACAMQKRKRPFDR